MLRVTPSNTLTLTSAIVATTSASALLTSSSRRFSSNSSGSSGGFTLSTPAVTRRHFTNSLSSSNSGSYLQLATAGAPRISTSARFIAATASTEAPPLLRQNNQRVSEYKNKNYRLENKVYSPRRPSTKFRDLDGTSQIILTCLFGVAGICFVVPLLPYLCFFALLTGGWLLGFLFVVFTSTLINLIPWGLLMIFLAVCVFGLLKKPEVVESSETTPQQQQQQQEVRKEPFQPECKEPACKPPQAPPLDQEEKKQNHARVVQKLKAQRQKATTFSIKKIREYSEEFAHKAVPLAGLYQIGKWIAPPLLALLQSMIIGLIFSAGYVFQRFA